MLLGDPRGAASAANFSPFSTNHGAGGDRGIPASPAFAGASASSPACPVLAAGRAWRSRGWGVYPPPPQWFWAKELGVTLCHSPLPPAGFKRLGQPREGCAMAI